MAKKQTDPAGTADPTPIETEEAAPEVAADPTPVETVRRLRLHRAYQGAQSREYPILPGLYFEDDPELYSLANFLVTNQYGEWIY